MNEIRSRYSPLMTVREAAELLRRTEKHVRDKCRDKTIKATHLDGRWLIDRDALIEKVLGD